MDTKNNVMKFESTLPEDFDGTFRFTNWTDEEFIGRWGGKEYVFPAQTTSPMIIPDQTPLEIQQIRKKFAKDLAEREFFRGQSYANLMKQERNADGSPRLNGIHSAGTYNLDQLAPFIQRCLEPLPAGKVKVQPSQTPKLEEKLHKDEEGNIVTEAIDKKMSLKKKALESA